MKPLDILVIITLLSTLMLGLTVYILAAALKQALDKVNSLASQILTFKAHTQAGAHAAAQVLHANKLAGLAGKKKDPPPAGPKEKKPDVIIRTNFH